MPRRKQCRRCINRVTVQPHITHDNHPVGPLILPVGKPITKVPGQSGIPDPRLHRRDVLAHPVDRHHDDFGCGRTKVQDKARCPGITVARLPYQSGVQDEPTSGKVE